MKRIKWFKTLCLSMTPVAAIAPVVLTSTSCSSTSVSIDNYTYSTLKAAVDSGSTKFETYSSSTIDYKDLLIGHKKITDGNYVLIVGSNSMPTTCKFFTKGLFRRKNDWYNQYFIDSILHDAINEDVEKKAKIPFTFFNVVDFCVKEFYDKSGHRIYLSDDGNSPDVEYINPYKKWDETLITHTYKYNSEKCGYEWDKESVTKDTYIRTDASAVAYRTFNDMGAKLWPVDEKSEPKRSKTFNTSDSDSSRLVVFKAGKIVSIDDLPTSGAALATLINTHFNKTES